MAKLGTLDWISKTEGKLGFVDKLTLIAQGVRAKAANKQDLKTGRKVRLREVADIIPPDTAITREALALCRQASETYLFNHCLRAYFWARLLDDDARTYDDEAMFTAMMLHDLGLTESYRPKAGQERCFTAVGAEKVTELAIKHGWSDRRAQSAANAITLHLNVIIGSEHGKEAQMVKAGAVADVAGIGLHRLQIDQLAKVLEKYPRLQMKQNIIKALDHDATTCPHCRIAFLKNQLGIMKLIAQTRVFKE